jgi:hypothetical protein
MMTCPQQIVKQTNISEAEKYFYKESGNLGGGSSGNMENILENILMMTCPHQYVKQTNISEAEMSSPPAVHGQLKHSNWTKI